jgi:hypothetical protein
MIVKRVLESDHYITHITNHTSQVKAMASLTEVDETLGEDGLRNMKAVLFESKTSTWLLFCIRRGHELNKRRPAGGSWVWLLGWLVGWVLGYVCD